MLALITVVSLTAVLGSCRRDNPSDGTVTGDVTVPETDEGGGDEGVWEYVRDPSPRSSRSDSLR